MKKIGNKGFTLVEVLAVVAIIAIIGLIAVPNVLSVIKTGKNSSYKAMIENVKTASKDIFKEIDYMDQEIYNYDTEGNKNDRAIIIQKDEKTNNEYIDTNLQTLVRNGFLSGSNNDDNSSNKNSKIILDPKTNEDIGACKIRITKYVSNVKVCYEVKGYDDVETNPDCPTTEDFGGSEQCELVNKDNAGYNIKYNEMGGEKCNPNKKSVVRGNTYGDLCTTTRHGYTFGGWYIEETYETPVTKDTLVSKNEEHTLYAKWQANPLIFEDKNITKTYSTKSQTVNVTLATNETGSYTYNGTPTEYISISETGLITIKENTPVGTYDYIITATDNNSNVTATATYTITINKAPASISYGTTSITKTYGDASFTNVFLTKTGDGQVTYSSSNTSVATIDVNGNVTINQAGETTITATVTDGINYTYSTKTASYKLKVNKGVCLKPSNVKVSTAGYVTFSGTTNATEYQISIDNSEWTSFTSGSSYLGKIIAKTGSRTVYVRAICNSPNYEETSLNATKDVTVYKVTINSNNTSYGEVNVASYNVISGATVSVSNNYLYIKGITTGTSTTTLKTVTATANTGFSFGSWSKTSGSITATTTITANFEGNTNTLYLDYQNNVLDPTYENWTLDGTSSINVAEGDDGTMAIRLYSDAGANTGARIPIIGDIDPNKDYKFKASFIQSNANSGSFGDVSLKYKAPTLNSTGSVINNNEIILGTLNDIPDYKREEITDYYGPEPERTINSGSYSSWPYAYLYFSENIGTDFAWVGNVRLDRFDTVQFTNGSSLPTPARTGYRFNGWSEEKDTISVLFNERTGNHRRTMLSNLVNGESYTVTMDSAVLLSGSGTKFKWRLYNLTKGAVQKDESGNEVSGTVNYSSSTISFNISTPNTYNHINEDVGLQFLAGEAGNEGNAVAFTNVRVATYDDLLVFYDKEDYIKERDSKYSSTPTLYAHWTPNKYTVTFNTNGGSVSTSTKTVTYSYSYGTLPTPTRTGYTFNGWYTASSGGTKITQTSLVNITADQTLYAQWTATSVSLYNAGTVNTSLTGSFSGVKTCGFNTCNADFVGTGSVTLGTSTMTIKGATGGYASVFTNKRINLSNYSTAKITITKIDSGNNGGDVRIGFTQSQDVNYNGTCKKIAVGTISIDISSLSGSYYLAASFTGETAVTISKIELIP